MAFNLKMALDFLPAIGPAMAAIPAVKAVWEGIVETFDADSDQALLRDAYDDLVADNKAGHDRLQKKLAKIKNG